ncbi:MAG: Aminoglycoside phosphotransferase [Acidobacteria bacterium]|nr:Aminoglycoside phosphotransferase [Acidobacteriota bacterium]
MAGPGSVVPPCLDNKPLSGAAFRKMSSPKHVSLNGFASSAAERLEQYLAAKSAVQSNQIIPLTPDASTRNYFRVPWKKGTAVAAVYPEAFDPEVHPYLDVTRLFLDAGIPVPAIYSIDGERGIIVQEDLGDQQLSRFLESASEEDCEEYKERAINLIARIQKATEKAAELKSIASRLAFDEPKLSWELGFFREHYFGSLRGESLKRADEAELRVELNDLAAELAAVPRVLCHRDFHAANLLIDSKKHLRVIDHQDARMGPASYDLVSLLLDRQTCAPSLAELRHHRLYLLEERRLLGLSSLDPDEFAREFRLVTVQRGLKAVGTFSYQTAVCGRGVTYEPLINPLLEMVVQAAEWLERFPVLRRMLSSRL